MQRVVFWFTRVFFSALLLGAAVGKLLDNRGFAAVIATYQLSVPEPLLLPLALSFSLFELVLGVGLVLGQRLAAVARVNVALHVGYLALATATNLRGIPLANCGCFGVFLARPMRWSTVWEDVALLALALGFAWSLDAGWGRAPALREPRAA